MSYLQKITLMKTFPNSLSELQNRLIKRIFFVAVAISLFLKEAHATCKVFSFVSCFFKHKVKK